MKTTQKELALLKINLIKEGLDEDDVSLSIALLLAIEWLDGELFPQNPCRISLCKICHRNGFFAQYVNKRPGIAEEYTVFIPGLMRLMKGGFPGRIFGLRNGRIRLLARAHWKEPSLSEKVMMTTIHEVRHRLQYRKTDDYQTFNQWNVRKIKDPLIRWISRYIRFYMRNARRFMAKEGHKSAFIDCRSNSLEFDSNVVELLALHYVQSPSDMIQILKAGPSTRLTKRP